jgi:hypothetical protein
VPASPHGGFDRILQPGSQLAGAVPLPPAPGLPGLAALAAQVQAAGVPVDLHVDADPGALPPDLGEAVYRIVQEALTNVIKHAGPCRATVTVTRTPEWLDVRRGQLADAIRTAVAGDTLLAPVITRRLIERFCRQPHPARPPVSSPPGLRGGESARAGAALCPE